MMHSVQPINTTLHVHWTVLVQPLWAGGGKRISDCVLLACILTQCHTGAARWLEPWPGLCLSLDSIVLCWQWKLARTEWLFNTRLMWCFAPFFLFCGVENVLLSGLVLAGFSNVCLIPQILRISPVEAMHFTVLGLVSPLESRAATIRGCNG